MKVWGLELSLRMIKNSLIFLYENQTLRDVILFTQPHRFLMAKTNPNLNQFLWNKNKWEYLFLKKLHSVTSAEKYIQ